jgi:hypothetical protein
MLVREGQGLGAEVLAEYNGQKFKHNDLVDVIMGTGVGVPWLKTEPLKATCFKWLRQPLVGSSRGPCPQYPRHSVFKLNAFGACVLGTRQTRFFSKLKPAMQERLNPLLTLTLSFIYFFFLCLLIYLRLYISRGMSFFSLSLPAACLLRLVVRRVLFVYVVLCA